MMRKRRRLDSYEDWASYQMLMKSRHRCTHKNPTLVAASMSCWMISSRRASKSCREMVGTPGMLRRGCFV